MNFHIKLSDHGPWAPPPFPLHCRLDCGFLESAESPFVSPWFPAAYVRDLVYPSIYDIYMK